MSAVSMAQKASSGIITTAAIRRGMTSASTGETPMVRIASISSVSFIVPSCAAIIAIAGCYQGMQVESDAEQVGTRTTTAVVQAIFLVIVLDAFFAVFFTEVGWN